MASGDNRRPEQPICRDANEQEDRDHDRRNKVTSRLSSQSHPDRQIGVRSQQGVECHRYKAEAGDHYRGV
jgi:hypothetical protein